MYIISLHKCTSSVYFSGPQSMQMTLCYKQYINCVLFLSQSMFRLHLKCTSLKAQHNILGFSSCKALQTCMLLCLLYLSMRASSTSCEKVLQCVQASKQVFKARCASKRLKQVFKASKCKQQVQANKKVFKVRCAVQANKQVQASKVCFAEAASWSSLAQQGEIDLPPTHQLQSTLFEMIWSVKMPVKQWNLAESLETESFESHKKLLCVQHVGTTSEQALLKCFNPAFNKKNWKVYFKGLYLTFA